MSLLLLETGDPDNLLLEDDFDLLLDEPPFGIYLQILGAWVLIAGQS
jgi:hypothetical protein